MKVVYAYKTHNQFIIDYYFEFGIYVVVL